MPVWRKPREYECSRMGAFHSCPLEVGVVFASAEYVDGAGVYGFKCFHPRKHGEVEGRVPNALLRW